MLKHLNLGILAHVDAGKTSLTERLLFETGIIKTLGSVDKGNTQTDSLALEQRRGITIKSAVVSFTIGDLKINLIDTPGHPDFIAEVKRVLGVLDGVVLVISAVEGVQPQTRILMRTLQRLRIPTIIFVNKIDRGGAQYERTLSAIASKLLLEIAPMGTVVDIGTRDARFVIGKALTTDRLTYPVFFGSAITGAGISELLNGIQNILPTGKGAASDPVSGNVFKIDRGPAGEKIAFVCMRAGMVHVRDKLHFGANKTGKVTAISVFGDGVTAERKSIMAGEIGKLKGLANVQVGDSIGLSGTKEQHYFAPPTLETVITPTNIADKGRLHAALDQLAEQDPLINLRQDDAKNELYVSLYGEVQKEVIQTTLATDFGIAVGFQKTTPICIERPKGVGRAVRLLQEESNPTTATVGLSIQPAPAGSGITFKLAVKPHLVPVHIYKTTGSFIEHMTDYVRQTLNQGLSGWKVTDCLVTMFECNYYVADGMGKPISATPKTIASDFRKLTPLVLGVALRQAGTVVCEPICHFELEVPADALSPVLPVLAKLNAVPKTTTARDEIYALGGDIPAARVHELQQRLPALTSGEGLLEYAFDRYEPKR